MKLYNKILTLFILIFASSIFVFNTYASYIGGDSGYIWIIHPVLGVFCLYGLHNIMKEEE